MVLLAPAMTAWMLSSSELGKPGIKLRLSPTSFLLRRIYLHRLHRHRIAQRQLCDMIARQRWQRDWVIRMSHQNLLFLADRQDNHFGRIDIFPGDALDVRNGHGLDTGAIFFPKVRFLLITASEFILGKRVGDLGFAGESARESVDERTLRCIQLFLGDSFGGHALHFLEHDGCRVRDGARFGLEGCRESKWIVNASWKTRSSRICQALIGADAIDHPRSKPATA